MIEMESQTHSRAGEDGSFLLSNSSEMKPFTLHVDYPDSIPPLFEECIPASTLQCPVVGGRTPLLMLSHFAKINICCGRNWNLDNLQNGWPYHCARDSFPLVEGRGGIPSDSRFYQVKTEVTNKSWQNFCSCQGEVNMDSSFVVQA